MVATQLNPMIVDESLAKHTVVNLTSFVSNAVQGRRLIIVLGLDIVPYSGDRIGSPANIESAANQAEAKPAPAAAAAPQAVRGNQAPRAQAARQGAPAAAPVFPIEALSPYSNKYVESS